MNCKLFFLVLILFIFVFTPLQSARTQGPPSARVIMPVMAANTSPIFFVTIQGAKQGAFRGDSANPAHRNQIEGLRFSIQLSSPRDASSGQAIGKHQYSPVTFTKLWDGASPQILSAAATNEVLTDVQFDFVKIAPDGKEYVYQTVKLAQASISSVRQYLGVPGSGDPTDPRPLEDISFTFRKIEITNNDAKTTFAGDWSATL